MATLSLSGDRAIAELRAAQASCMRALASAPPAVVHAAVPLAIPVVAAALARISEDQIESHQCHANAMECDGIKRSGPACCTQEDVILATHGVTQVSKVIGVALQEVLGMLEGALGCAPESAPEVGPQVKAFAREAAYIGVGATAVGYLSAGLRARDALKYGGRMAVPHAMQEQRVLRVSQAVCLILGALTVCVSPMQIAECRAPESKAHLVEQLVRAQVAGAAHVVRAGTVRAALDQERVKTALDSSEQNRIKVAVRTARIEQSRALREQAAELIEQAAKLDEETRLEAKQ